jgi:hypothetical protein
MEKTPPETLVHAFDFSVLSLTEESIPLVKSALINYYSIMTLRHYQQTGQFLNPLTICLELPRKVKELYASNPALFERNPAPHSAEQLTLNLLGGTGLGKAPQVQQVLPIPLVRSPIPSPAPSPVPVKAADTKKKAAKEVKEKKVNPGANWTKDASIVAAFADHVKNEYEQSPKPETKFKDLLLGFTEKTGHQVGDRWNQRNEAVCEKLGILYEQVKTSGFKGAGTYFVFLRPKQGPSPLQTLLAADPPKMVSALAAPYIIDPPAAAGVSPGKEHPQAPDNSDEGESE